MYHLATGMQTTRARSLALVLAVASATGAQEDAPGAAATATGTIACNRSGQILLLDAATGAETVLVADNTYDRPLYWMPGGDRLVYWNHDGGAWDLWAVDPDTAERANLTRTARDNRSPCASPDGAHIAFHRGGDGVWLMDRDGGNQRQVHERGHRDGAPVWSPSGRRLAFCDLEPAGEDRVAVVVYTVPLADGAPGEGARLGNGEPCFFLDERQLVIEAAHDGRHELVIVDVGSGDRRALTRSEAREHRAVLAPDRGSIAWIDSSEAGDRLVIMPSGGGDVRELAKVDHWFAPPSFSPDGRFLAFESGTERGKTQVHVVPAAGGDVRCLTADGGSFPVWRPTPVRRK